MVYGFGADDRGPENFPVHRFGSRRITPLALQFRNAGPSAGATGATNDVAPAPAAQAARFGATAALVRSLTFAADDVPHAGMTGFPPEMAPIPCAALGRQSADRLSAALQADPTLRVVLTINARRLPAAPSHNVIGEIRGPGRLDLAGGHSRVVARMP
jgi:hypothetical protein